MGYANVQDVTDRLTTLRARGDEASLEEASRIEREYEEAVGDAALAPAIVPPSDPSVPVTDVAAPAPPEAPPPVTEPPAGSERRGFASSAAEADAEEVGLTADEILDKIGDGSGKGGAITVRDVKEAANA